MNKKAVVLLAEGFEEIEALSVVDILRRAGVECKMCSISGEMRVKGGHGIEVVADMVIGGLTPHGIDAVILPGGLLGAKNLKESLETSRLISECDESKSIIIAAICAAPIVIEALGVLAGRKATSYPGSLEQPMSCDYVDDKLCVVDGHVITSRGPATVPFFAFEILAGLGLQDKADALKEGMMYNFMASCF